MIFCVFRYYFQLQYKEAEGSSFRDGSFTEAPGTPKVSKLRLQRHMEVSIFYLKNCRYHPLVKFVSQNCNSICIVVSRIGHLFRIILALEVMYVAPGSSSRWPSHCLLSFV